jgi:hypothetical protein
LWIRIACKKKKREKGWKKESIARVRTFVGP